MLLKTIARKTMELKNHRIDRIEQQDDEKIILYLKAKKRRRLESSCCTVQSRVIDHLPQRRWSHVSLWGLKVQLVYGPGRVRCSRCGRAVVEAIPWSLGKCRLTTPLIMYITLFAELLPWKQVAALFSVHWSTVRNAVAQAVDYGLAHREIGTVLYFGVDEISRKKGHVYCTNVYDLKEKRLLWTGQGREKATIDRFFAEIGSELTRMSH